MSGVTRSTTVARDVALPARKVVGVILTHAKELEVPGTARYTGGGGSLHEACPDLGRNGRRRGHARGFCGFCGFCGCCAVARRVPDAGERAVSRGGSRDGSALSA